MFKIIGILLCLIAAFYAFAPEDRISDVNSALRRMVNDPGQTCFDYVATELNDPRSAYLLNSSHVNNRVEITYRAKNLLGAYISEKFTCRLSADGSIGDVEELLMSSEQLRGRIQKHIQYLEDK
ncbi:MAG: hypothetical protein IIA77_09345 [Proteobacteria bacterium]|nr:hypothetical protein [Pseudomonadota bacterium]